MQTVSLRRSKRIKENLESQKSVTKTDTKPAKNRAANVKPPVSESESKYAAGPRGPLQQMTEIPLDALHEILRHLDPMDLLNLSWASRNLNLIVMEKSARYIWKESFERLYESKYPPPRCPEEFSLAQYARFLFYNTCMICEKYDSQWVSWPMRLRVCAECLEGPCFTRAFYLIENEHPIIANKHHRYSLKADIENGSSKNSESRRASLLNREEGHPAFLVWEQHHFENVKDQIRLQRQNAILAKLEEHGWKETEITEMYGGGFPADLAGFWRSTKLTNADWKNIRPRILKQLRTKRNKLMQEKADIIFRKRWRSFRVKLDEWTKARTIDLHLLPRDTDLAIVEPFKFNLFESDEETVEFELDEIDRVAKEWIESRNKRILSLIPEYLQERYRENGFLSWESLSILIFQRRKYSLSLLDVLREREYWCKRSTLQPENQKIYRLLSRAGGLVPWDWSYEDLTFDREYRRYRKSRDYHS